MFNICGFHLRVFSDPLNFHRILEQRARKSMQLVTCQCCRKFVNSQVHGNEEVNLCKQVTASECWFVVYLIWRLGISNSVCVQWKWSLPHSTRYNMKGLGGCVIRSFYNVRKARSLNYMRIYKNDILQPKKVAFYLSLCYLIFLYLFQCFGLSEH